MGWSHPPVFGKLCPPVFVWFCPPDFGWIQPLSGWTISLPMFGWIMSWFICLCRETVHHRCPVFLPARFWVNTALEWWLWGDFNCPCWEDCTHRCLGFFAIARVGWIQPLEGWTCLLPMFGVNYEVISSACVGRLYPPVSGVFCVPDFRWILPWVGEPSPTYFGWIIILIMVIRQLIAIDTHQTTALTQNFRQITIRQIKSIYHI